MKKRKILLVDDDVKNSMFLKRFIEEASYEVTYANNGQIGWELYQSEKPDLILLDVNMPVMNGFELAKKIREQNSKVLIFFLTDRTEKDDRLKGFSLKGNDYIPKPFYPEELIAKMEERLKGEDVEEQTVFTFGKTSFNYAQCSLSCGGEKQSLSVRQADILKMLASRMNEIVERDEILTEVWGNDSYANSLALNVQITYLRRLLACDSSLSIVSLKKKGYELKVE
jgi:DNA-binding response OmpR family regulator